MESEINSKSIGRVAHEPAKQKQPANGSTTLHKVSNYDSLYAQIHNGTVLTLPPTANKLLSKTYLTSVVEQTWSMSSVGTQTHPRTTQSILQVYPTIISLDIGSKK